MRGFHRIQKHLLEFRYKNASCTNHIQDLFPFVFRKTSGMCASTSVSVDVEWQNPGWNRLQGRSSKAGCSGQSCVCIYLKHTNTFRDNGAEKKNPSLMQPELKLLFFSSWGYWNKNLWSLEKMILKGYHYGCRENQNLLLSRQKKKKKCLLYFDSLHLIVVKKSLVT